MFKTWAERQNMTMTWFRCHVFVSILFTIGSLSFCVYFSQHMVVENEQCNRDKFYIYQDSTYVGNQTVRYTYRNITKVCHIDHLNMTVNSSCVVYVNNYDQCSLMPTHCENWVSISLFAVSILGMNLFVYYLLKRHHRALQQSHTASVIPYLQLHRVLQHQKQDEDEYIEQEIKYA